MSQGLMKEKILRVAQRLIQTRGYNGFSFKDVAHEVGIRTSSIHYHFASKAELGFSLIKFHREEVEKHLLSINAQHQGDHAKALRAFSDIFVTALDDQKKLCFCSMLVHELQALPEGARGELKKTFLMFELWLENMLSSGRDQNAFAFDGEPASMARQMLAAWEGAAMLAKAFNEPERIYQIEALIR